MLPPSLMVFILWPSDLMAMIKSKYCDDDTDGDDKSVLVSSPPRGSEAPAVSRINGLPSSHHYTHPPITYIFHIYIFTPIFHYMSFHIYNIIPTQDPPIKYIFIFIFSLTHTYSHLKCGICWEFHDRIVPFQPLFLKLILLSIPSDPFK